MFNERPPYLALESDLRRRLTEVQAEIRAYQQEHGDIVKALRGFETEAAEVNDLRAWVDSDGDLWHENTDGSISCERQPRGYVDVYGSNYESVDQAWGPLVQVLP